MFEDSLVESGGRIKTKKGSTVFVSAVVHVGLVLLLIIVPLIFTEQIEGAKLSSFLMAPPPPLAAAPQGAPQQVTTVAKPQAVKPVQVDPKAFLAPTEVPKETAKIFDATDSAATATGVAGCPGCLPGGVKSGGVPGGIEGGIVGGALPSGNFAPPPPPPPPAAAPPPPPPPPPPAAKPPKEPVRIGGDVQAGNLVYSPNPTYPPLARQARIEGKVILNATIAEDGTIKNLTVITQSNQLLLQGVIDTVKTWKYKPTKLNGEPVEVLTTITINFTLGR